MARSMLLRGSAALIPAIALGLPSLGKDKVAEIVPPAPAREFRGVWVATVDNIDWPSRPGIPTEQQKAELLAILDRASQLRLNAVLLQVRPACDALYASKLEPWSEYLTGQMGRAPEPAYDPLAFAVEEAHRRGLELHAWFNPYRARHPSAKSEISTDHISKTRPELVRTYGKHLWLDPGEPAVRQHSLDVVLDVVRRYDVDGVHIDDYFYPYKERNAAGEIIPFPDDASWDRYTQGGGKLNRDDWRRSNVDGFVEQLYARVKREKRWVKVGISPFGIWRPGYPPQIKGFDAYQELYGDARKWFKNAWVDYMSPQLYWRTEQTAQSYPVLLKWWSEQNPQGRHLWPGNFTSKVADGSRTSWSADDLLSQIRLTREQPTAGGNIHFSMRALMPGREGLGERLASESYAQPALVPPCPWLAGKAPGKPRAEVKEDTDGVRRLQWKPVGGEPVRWWYVQLRRGTAWTSQLLPAERLELPLALGDRVPDAAAVSTIDRAGNQGTPVVLSISHTAR